MDKHRTVLQVVCGSCSNQVNVPASLLQQLLAAQSFNCPHCRSSQQLKLPEGMVESLMQQVSGTAAPRSAVSTVRGRIDKPRGPYPPRNRGQGAPVQSGDYKEEQQHTSSSGGGYLDSLASLSGSSKRKQAYEDGSWATYDDRDVQRSFLDHEDYLYGSARDQERQRKAARQLQQQQDEDEDEGGEDADASKTFMDYRPSKLSFGKPHPDRVVETASLASVEAPGITYKLHLNDQVAKGALSSLQLESIVYAAQRHETLLPDGQRAGFFIGDGAGVGKGRTIAGLILENWRCKRKKHLWLSIGSDLRFDSRRDLDDVNARDIPLHPLNKLPYGSLASKVPEGVIFLTYSSLISSSDKGASRLEQLVSWCGPGFDGLIVYDECHKAKNLVPDSGGRATKVGEKVVELQRLLPNARVVYCSATGASEPRNLAYMVRLGLWGGGNPAFPDFGTFLSAISSRGVAALELMAMDLKAQGAYVARTLSFEGWLEQLQDCNSVWARDAAESADRRQLIAARPC